MPKLSDIRRIIPEDVEEEATPVEIMESIAGSYNEFADELYDVINGRLDFENLAREKITLEITFDSSGTPTSTIRFRTNLSFVSMIHLGNILNVSNTNARLTQAPYLNWSYEGGGIVKINYGVGFLSGNKYRLTLEVVQ
jgi:hypothetical protein